MAEEKDVLCMRGIAFGIELCLGLRIEVIFALTPLIVYKPCGGLFAWAIFICFGKCPFSLEKLQTKMEKG